MNPDDTAPPTAHRCPAQGPHAGAAEDLRLWAELSTTDRARVADSAGKWRAGTAGLFTALAGLLFLKGPDTSAINDTWRPWVICCVVAAAVAVMASLWCALAAEAPPLATLDYREVIAKHGGVSGYQAASAETAALRLARARGWAIAGLALFLTGTTLWWLAPKPSTPAALMSVTYLHQRETKTLCGELLTTHAGDVLFRVPGQDQPIPVPLAEVRDLAPRASCPG